MVVLLVLELVAWSVVVLLAEDLELANELKDHGIVTQTIQAVEKDRQRQIKVYPAKILSEILQQLGRHTTCILFLNLCNCICNTFVLSRLLWTWWVLVAMCWKGWLVWLPEVCKHRLPVSLLVGLNILILPVLWLCLMFFICYKWFLCGLLNMNMV